MQITYIILESFYTGCETYPVSYCVGQGGTLCLREKRPDRENVMT